MTLKLLHDLAQQRLPLDIVDMAQIDQLRCFRAAGLVSMLVTRTPFGMDPPQWVCMARVLAITPEGRQALRVAAQEDARKLAAHPTAIPDAAVSASQP